MLPVNLTLHNESCFFRAVNLIRTIISSLYLLLMVLLPWMHMPSHGQPAEEQIQTAHACGHHHHDHEDQENPERDDCGLCSLAVVPIDLPSLFVTPEVLLTFSNNPRFTLHVSDGPLSRLHQARAPPFMSV